MQALTSKQELKGIYGAGLLFVLLNAFFLYNEVLWFIALPVALIIIGIALFKLDWLMLLIVCGTPVSVNLEDIGGFGLILPSEPLLFGALMVFTFKLIFDHEYDKRILKHPITLTIIAYLLWTFITSITSELPSVSFKFFLAKLWFIVPLYFLMIKLFKYEQNINRYYWFYIVPMCGVIIYTIVRHYLRGFDEEAAHWIMQPFFKDHTSYGAMIAFFMPAALLYSFHSKWHINARVLAGFFFMLLTVGVILSYTRAAWVSLVGALGLYLVIVFRVRLWILIAVGATAILFFLSFQTQVMQKLEKNKQDSSGDLAEHVESISNVATDASNLERLNRWDCAFKMFFESPLVGKGPGTYSFLYAPYQHSSNLTIISTNFGDGGNAHSEYFGPLAEQGVPGLLTFLAIIIAFYSTSIPLYYRLVDEDMKRILMGAILGVTTYLIHGMLNNFLDGDKASVAIWGCLAIVTAIHFYHQKQESNSTDAISVSE